MMADGDGGALPACGSSRAWVIAALSRRAPDFGAAITDDTPLTDDGLCLESLALMEVIAEVETTFGITVTDTDISPENFGTVGSLLRFIEGAGRRR